MSVFFFTLFLIVFLGVYSDLYPSSCVDLDDGTYSLKLSDDSNKPLVSVKCSNGYAILDYSYDNNIQQYFKSWDSWYPEFIGPSNEHIVNWEDWINFYENDDDISMTLSPDCSECDATYDDAKYGYYLTGTAFGCAWNRVGLRDCDYHYEESLDSYTCHDCATAYSPTILSADTNWINEAHSSVGVCPIYISASNLAVPTDHAKCMTRGTDNLKPSLGIKGSFCVCVKPSQNEYFEYDNSDNSDTTGNGKGTLKNGKATIDEDVIYYINKKTFESGPLRISKPGIYILQEDIEFDFGESNYDDIFDENAWWPSSDDNENYPGAGGTHSAWFMGYFAGITVEADSVTIDLNGHSIGMSNVFYLVQRWFTNIELSTQYFNPGEGPFSSFGGNPFYASNIVIKNGKLGLTSHHSIHGNNNHNIVLENLDVSLFETHGIHLNGFEYLTIRNVDIHDNSKQAYLTESFGHVKALIPFIKKFAADSGDKKVRFKGETEDITWNEVIDTVEDQLNAVFKYALYGEEPEIGIDISEEDWEEALTTYYNKDGYFYGSSVHGLFLNSFGAQVFKYRLKTNYPSEYLTLNNVNIYNLYHKMQEAVSGKYNKVISTTYFASPYKVRDLYSSNFFNIYDSNDTSIQYKFNTNNFVKLYALYYNFVPSSEFGYLGSGTLPIHEIVLNYQIHKNNLQGSAKTIAAKSLTLMCGTDGMMHPGKGITAIRIEGVNQGTLNNVNIYDLYEKTPLGSELCGVYAQGAGTTVPSEGTFRYTYPIQRGFSGNNLQGILLAASSNIELSNIKINNLVSDYGISYGISLWPNTQTSFSGTIEIQNLNAGDLLEKDLYEYDDSPNFAPDACGIMLYQYFVDGTYGIDERLASTYSVSNDIEFDISNINGHYGCLGTDVETLVGLTESKNDNNNNHNKNSHSKGIFKHININLSTIIIGVLILSTIVTTIIVVVYQKKRKRNAIKYESVPTYQTF